MIIKEFEKLPLIGILRGIDKEIIEPLTESIISSGLKTIEITMNTADAPSLIKKMREVAHNRLAIGAGTVLSKDDLNKALDSGATFIVSPTLVDDVMEHCTNNSIPVFPGAFTPQEIFRAHKAGATMVKVFPIKFFGPDYIKEIKGPLNDIKLLACGGVNSSNIKSFFKAGANAIAFGGSVFNKTWLNKKDIPKIEETIRTLIYNSK